MTLQINAEQSCVTGNKSDCKTKSQTYPKQIRESKKMLVLQLVYSHLFLISRICVTKKMKCMFWMQHLEISPYKIRKLFSNNFFYCKVIFIPIFTIDLFTLFFYTFGDCRKRFSIILIALKIFKMKLYLFTRLSAVHIG